VRNDFWEIFFIFFGLLFYCKFEPLVFFGNIRQIFYITKLKKKMTLIYIPPQPNIALAINLDKKKGG
jgi:hypothetical protein